MTPSEAQALVEQVWGFVKSIEEVIPAHYGGQERLVTRDMAIDAGYPEMEGSHHSYDPCPNDCPACKFEYIKQALDQLSAHLQTLEKEARVKVLDEVLKELGSQNWSEPYSALLSIIDQKIEEAKKP